VRDRLRAGVWRRTFRPYAQVWWASKVSSGYGEHSQTIRTSMRSQGAGFRVHAPGVRLQGSGLWVEGSWFRVKRPVFSVYGLWSMVYGLWFSVQCSVFGVEGLGCRI
jgi:hypothetical protein